MTEMQVKDILCNYGYCLHEHREVCKVINEIPMNVWVKAWMRLLTKEDRIIVYLKLINGKLWDEINWLLELRWGEAGVRTEADLERRLCKAIRSIATFMNEYFPTINE